MLKWLRYSGASVAITLNPLHWAWIPTAGPAFRDEWAGPNESNWHARFLFVTVRVWTDDGSW
jgi:hypothetical protein